MTKQGKTAMRGFTSLVLVSALAAPLASQTQPPFGAFQNVPMAMIFEGADDTIYATSLDSGSVVAMPSTTTPDISSVFQTLIFAAGLNDQIDPEGLNPVVLDIDGMTSWNDLSPIELVTGTGGSPDYYSIIPTNVSPTQWAVFLASSGNGQPLQPGSIFDTLNQLLPSQGIGAEVVSYYTESSVIPGWIGGETFLEMSSLQRTFPASAGTQPVLQALDMGMPNVYEWGPAGGPVAMPSLVRVGFSLTPASAATFGTRMLPGSSLNPAKSGLDFSIDGTSVIIASWDTVTSKWVNFEVLVDHADLGLNPGDNVDALGIGKAPAGSNLGTGNEFDFIFTSHTRRGPSDNRNQLRLWTIAFGDRPILKDSQPLELSNGFHPDQDLRTFCGVDPEGAGYGRVWGVTQTNPGPIGPGTFTQSLAVVGDSNYLHSSTTSSQVLFGAFRGWGGEEPRDCIIRIRFANATIGFGESGAMDLYLFRPITATTFRWNQIMPANIELKVLIEQHPMPSDSNPAITRSAVSWIRSKQ